MKYSYMVFLLFLIYVLNNFVKKCLEAIQRNNSKQGLQNHRDLCLNLGCPTHKSRDVDRLFNLSLFRLIRE